jgi:hypothetical protein
MLAFLLALANWPVTKQFIPGMADPPVIQSAGAVEEVSYIEGLATRTQVRTKTRTMLLSGAIELELGTLVERRVTPRHEFLCVVGTDRCAKIVSR